MSIHLPITPPIELITVEEAAITDIFALSAMHGKRRAEAILTQLISNLTEHPEYAAACLIDSNAHGYDGQDLLLQSRNGAFIHRKWLGLSGTKETEEPISVSGLDLVIELQALRDSQVILRDIGFVNDNFGGLIGRYLRVYLATANSGEWLSCPAPQSDQIYQNNPVTRIFHALWGIALD